MGDGEEGEGEEEEGEEGDEEEEEMDVTPLISAGGVGLSMGPTRKSKGRGFIPRGASKAPKAQDAGVAAAGGGQTKPSQEDAEEVEEEEEEGEGDGVAVVVKHVDRSRATGPTPPSGGEDNRIALFPEAPSSTSSHGRRAPAPSKQRAEAAKVMLAAMEKSVASGEVAKALVSEDDLGSSMGGLPLPSLSSLLGFVGLGSLPAYVTAVLEQPRTVNIALVDGLATGAALAVVATGVVLCVVSVKKGWL